MTANQYKSLFLVYFNEFISVAGFAAWLGVSQPRAKTIILKGRALHQDQFGHH